MSQFEIHVGLMGFNEEQAKNLKSIISSVPISYQTCELDIVLNDIPKMHVIFVTNSIFEQLQARKTASDESETTQQQETQEDQTQPESELNQLINKVKVKSPHCMFYLLAEKEQILSLEPSQREVFRDFIIFPDENVLISKRLNLLVSELYDKLVKKVKKQQLKRMLDASDAQSATLQASLSQSHESTKQANKHLIRLLSNQVFARMGQRASGRNQQLNLLLVEVAKASNLNEQEIQDLTNAWHLRNVGKMAFSDNLLQTPYIKLSAQEQRVFNSHPLRSHAALMIVRPLDKAAKIILQHKEKIDGSGYPHALTGDKISLQAQVLSVLNDYTELVAGRHSDRQFSTVDALEYLDFYASEKYNDDVVKHLMKILPALSNQGQGMHDLLLSSKQLKPGMQLTRDLISKEGILLLSEGLRLDNESISRLYEMEENLEEHFKIFIKKK